MTGEKVLQLSLRERFLDWSVPCFVRHMWVLGVVLGMDAYPGFVDHL